MESLRGTQGLERFQQILVTFTSLLILSSPPAHRSGRPAITPFPLATTFHILPVTILSYFFKMSLRDFLVVQWLRLWSATAGGCGVGSPRLGSKIPYAKGQKKRGKAERTRGHPLCWSH